MELLKGIKTAILFCLLTGFGFAQQGSLTISGRVIEETSSTPIPYAKVVARSIATESVISGTTTDETGAFTLKTDSTNIYVQISFIGFDNKEIRDLQADKPTIDLGDISLTQPVQNLEGVTVSAEKSTMEFKLDKRVFNVGSDISSTGMGALEVLNNVPSVSVDIEGVIRLRGNEGVQILIDGKPSVLSDEASNALGTITADMIESIEIITNPSAKYDASGTSGIINIILKKDEKKGLNGSISVNTGWPHNHSVGGSINYRASKFNFFTQFGVGYRSLPSYNNSENRSYIDNTSIISDGVGYRNENFYNLTLGTDYYINKYNTITLSGNVAYEIESQPSETNFYLYDSIGNLSSSYTRTEETSALNPKYKYDFHYKKQFKNKEDHTLDFSSLGSLFAKDQSSDFFNRYSTGISSIGDQKTATNFYQIDQTYQINYTNPLTEKVTLEAGAMYEINNVGNEYTVKNDSAGVFYVDSSLTNNFSYSQKVLGTYLTGAYEGKKWGVKLGLRAENTDLKTVLETTSEENQQLYTNLFPTVHTSYKVSKKVQFQAGYSKRIFRPRLWDLNPFFNIRNNYNFRTGNPNLLPEFADSYEFTGIFLLSKFTLNSSLYYLHTTDVKENITTFQDGVTITMPMNIGTRDKVGVEANWKYPVAKWLTLNGDLNYGYFNRLGEYEGQNFDFSGDQWSGKLKFKFDLKSDVDVEVSTQYESKYKTVQGEVSGFAFVDLGVRKKIWKGKAVVNFAVRDVFASRIRETTVNQSTYYLYNFSQRGRFITLGFSYSFGKGEAMTYTGGRR